jgi:pheromone a factor receptor
MAYFYSPYYEVITFIALILLLSAAPSHVRARNTGTLLYIFWVGIGTLVVLINKIVWRDHTLNIAPVWCDICPSISRALSLVCCLLSVLP